MPKGCFAACQNCGERCQVPASYRWIGIEWKLTIRIRKASRNQCRRPRNRGTLKKLNKICDPFFGVRVWPAQIHGRGLDFQSYSHIMKAMGGKAIGASETGAGSVLYIATEDHEKAANRIS